MYIPDQGWSLWIYKQANEWAQVFTPASVAPSGWLKVSNLHSLLLPSQEVCTFWARAFNEPWN